MKLFIAATLATLTFGAGAQASHGTEQLAYSVGVEPGSYSLSQLVRLKGLHANSGERFRIDEIVEHPEGTQGDLRTHHRNQADPDALGWRNLAQSLGVEPGQYDPQQLVALQSAITNEDRARIAFITSAGSGESSADRAPTSLNTSQLARSLGVEPGLYSPDQLVRLKAFNNEPENAFRIREILENPDFG